jgi:chaperone BCS1
MYSVWIFISLLLTTHDSGPPGTGKSSLSFALAGLFGLNVHVISLLEPTLTETDLAMLFNNLPKRCIVLLEDIDTAGLARTDNDDESELKTLKETKDDNITAADLVKELKKPGRRGGGGMGGGTTIDGESKMGISLSGLLNAIDGVASHEGRVLVMTTNHPEKLDPALIRPGRVDMQIAFTLATKHQIREIFSKMYHSNEQPTDSATALSDKPPLANGINGHAKVNDHSPYTNGSVERILTPKPTKRHYLQEEIRNLANNFADLVPEGTFSPAEVQNFLITRKKDPQRAMDEVEKWRDELLEAKEKKTKVVDAR